MDEFINIENITPSEKNTENKPKSNSGYYSSNCFNGNPLFYGNTCKKIF